MNTAVRVHTNQETGMSKYLIIERVFSNLDQQEIDGKVIEESEYKYGSHRDAEQAGQLRECDFA